jgi:hypothetical protein
MTTYKGGCHCGAVAYEVETDLAKVIECNCSHCHKKGMVLAFVEPEKFKLLSGESAQQEYRFNTKKIQHLFCTACGVQSFARGRNQKDEDLVCVNVRCLDGVDLAALEITKVNGKDF